MGMTIEWIENTINEAYGPGAACEACPALDAAAIDVSFRSSGWWFRFQISHHTACMVEAAGAREKAQLLELAAEAGPVGGLYGPEELAAARREALCGVLRRLGGRVGDLAHSKFRAAGLAAGFPMDQGAFKVTLGESRRLADILGTAIVQAVAQVEEEALAKIQALSKRVLELETTHAGAPRPRSLNRDLPLGAAGGSLGVSPGEQLRRALGIDPPTRRLWAQETREGLPLTQGNPPPPSPPTEAPKALPGRDKCPWIFPWPEPADWNEGAT